MTSGKYFTPCRACGYRYLVLLPRFFFLLLSFESLYSWFSPLSFCTRNTHIYTEMWFRKDPDRDHPPSSGSDTQDSVPRRKLPPQLQQLVDHDDGFYDDVYSS